jgi:O-antigen/teichoic acid export membrane protein
MTNTEKTESITEIEELTKQIAKGGTVSLVGIILGRILEIALNIMLARFLKVSIYGLYILGITINRFSRIVASLGLQNGVVRFGSIYIGEGKNDRLKGTLFSAMGFSLVSSFIISVVLYMTAEFLSVRIFHKPALAYIIRILAFTVPIAIFTDLSASAARAFRKMDYMISTSILVPSLSQLVITFLLLAFGLGLNGVIYGFLISIFISSVFGGYTVFKIFPDIITTKPQYSQKQLMSYSLPTFFISLSYFLMARVNCLMLGYFKTSNVVGVYQASAAVASLLLLVHSSLVAIFGPIISDLHNRGKTNELVTMYNRITKWDFSITLLLFLFVVIFRNTIMRVFGSGFANASPVLMLLSMNSLIASVPGTTGLLLRMSGHQKLDLLNLICLVILNALLNLVLIPLFGSTGAATATLISQIVLNILQSFEIKILYGFIPLGMSHIRSMIVGLSVGSVIFLTISFLGNGLIYLTLSSIYALCLYFGLSFFIVMDNNEQNLIKGLLGRFIRIRSA